MSTPTQPTLEQLGVTVHKSVVGNPATGYVTWEDSKEFVLGQALPSPATAQQPAGGIGIAKGAQMTLTLRSLALAI